LFDLEKNQNKRSFYYKIPRASINFVLLGKYIFIEKLYLQFLNIIIWFFGGHGPKRILCSSKNVDTVAPPIVQVDSKQMHCLLKLKLLAPITFNGLAVRCEFKSKDLPCLELSLL